MTQNIPLGATFDNSGAKKAAEELEGALLKVGDAQEKIEHRAVATTRALAAFERGVAGSTRNVERFNAIQAAAERMLEKEPQNREAIIAALEKQRQKLLGTADAQDKLAASSRQWVTDSGAVVASLSHVEAAARQMQATLAAAAATGKTGFGELVQAAQALGRAQAQLASLAGTQATINRMSGASGNLAVAIDPSIRADYEAMWQGLADVVQRRQVELAAHAQRAVNAATGVQYWGEATAEARAEYEAFWQGVEQDMVARQTSLAGRAQRIVNEAAGVRYWGPLSQEVAADYEAMWQGLLAEQDEGSARLAAKVANDNERLAASYRSVIADVDPAFAAQQRYDQALATLRTGAAAAGVSVVQLAADEAKLAAAMSPAALEAKKQAESIEALKRAVDPAAYALKMLEKQKADLDAAFTAGKLSGGKAEYDALNAAIEQHRQGIIRTSASYKEMRNAIGLTNSQMMMLAPQVNDVVSGFAMGQTPMMIFTQQSGQIVQALSYQGVSLSAVKLGTVALYGAITAGVAAVAGAVAAWMSYTSSIRETERAIALTGNAVGLTRDGMEALAETAADAGDVSVSWSREMIAGFAEAGRIAPETMQRIIGLTRNYTLVTGKDATEATKDFAEQMQDPARALQTLAERYGLVSQAQVDHVRHLQEAGRWTEAQNELVAVQSRRYEDAARHVSGLAKVWDDVTTAASNAYNAVGKAIDRTIEGPDPAVRAQQLNAELARLKQPAAITVPLLGWQYDASGNAISGEAAARVKQVEAELAGVVQDLWDAGERLQAAARARVNAELQREEVAAVALARSLIPAEAETVKLTANQGQLSAALAKGGEHSGLFARALDALKLRMGALSDPVGEVARKIQLQLDVLRQAPGAARAAYAAVQAANENTPGRQGQTPDPAEVARLRDIEESRGRIESFNRAKALRDAADAQKALNAAQVAGNPTAVARATLDLDVAQRRANGEIIGAAEYQQRLNVAMGQAGVQLGQLALQHRTAAHAANLNAEAAGQGEAAQRAAAASAAIYAASIKGLGAQEAAYQEQLEKARRSEIHREFAGNIDLEVVANTRLAAAMRQGVAATREAEVYNKAVVQAMREVPPEYDAAGAATGAFSEAIAANVGKLKEQQKAADGVDLASYSSQLKDARRELEARQRTIGMSAEAKAVAKAEFDAMEYARKRYGEYDKITDAQRNEVDGVVGAARENAKLEQQIQRQEGAWQEVGNTFDSAFVRPLESAIDAIVKGQGETIKWSNILKGSVASFLADLARLAFMNPLKNWVLGSNSPTLWDAVGMAGQAGAAKGGGGPGASDILSLGSKFMPNSWTSGITSAIDSFGYSAFGLGGAGSFAVPGATAGTVIQGGMILEPGAGIVGMAEAVPGAASATAGLSAYLGPLGAGFAAGGLLGPMLANGNKAVGGLAGAASGAAAGALIGSIVPGVGTLIGALIGGAGGGLGGLIGTQKPSSEYAGAWVDATDGTITARASGADRTAKGKISPLEQRAESAVNAINAVVKAAGLTMTGNLWGGAESSKDGEKFRVGGWSGAVVSTSNDPAQIAADVLKYLAGATAGGAGVPTLGGNADVMAALRNSKATDATDLMADLQYAKDFRDSIAAMTSALGLEDQARKAGKQAADDLAKGITDFRDKAKELKLDVTAANTATKTWIDTLVTGAEPRTYTAMEAAVATLHAQWDNMLPVLQAVGYTAEQAGKKVEEGFTNNLARLAKAKTESLVSQTYEAQGRGYYNTLNQFINEKAVNVRDAMALGVSTRQIDDLFSAQVTNVLKGLSIEELDLVQHTYGVSSAIGVLVDAMKEARVASDAAAKATEDAAKAAQLLAYNNDLQARAYAAVGNDRTAALLRLDAQQAQELAEAKAAGYDTSRLTQVQAAERGRSAFDLAVKDYTDAIEQQIRAVNDNTQSAHDLVQANDNFAQSVRNALGDRLLNKDISPLSPWEQLQEARRQVTDTFTKASAGDENARSRIVGLLDTRDELARAYYASSDSTDFYDSQRKLEALGITAEDQLSAAERQVKLADAQVKELQRARDAANRMGERQLATAEQQTSRLAEMKSVMDQSYVVWQQALPALQAATGQNFYANNSQVTGILDSLLRNANASTIGNYRGYFMNSAENKEKFFKREHELGMYYGRDSYSDPFGDALYSRWDDQFQHFALEYLKALGYQGGWDANANIFLQARNLGDNFTSWIRMYGQAQHWPGFATGTDSAPPGMAWVGENGKELVQMAGGERVYPHAESMAMARSWAAANDRWAGVSEYRRSSDDSELVSEVRALREEVRSLRAERKQDALRRDALADIAIEENAKGQGRIAAALRVNTDRERAA